MSMLKEWLLDPGRIRDPMNTRVDISPWKSTPNRMRAHDAYSRAQELVEEGKFLEALLTLEDSLRQLKNLNHPLDLGLVQLARAKVLWNLEQYNDAMHACKEADEVRDYLSPIRAQQLDELRKKLEEIKNEQN